LCVLYYSALADSKGVETTCELAISFFEGRDNLPIYHVQWGYRFSLLNLYLHQRQFEKAEAHINMCTQLPSKGSYNWHLGMLQRCVYAFHTRQYDLVFTTYKEANTQLHKVKSKLLISRWSMIAAYLSLFQKFGLLTYPSRFRLYKYLNQEHQPFQKIHFYWLERLHLLADGKWQQLEHLLIETGQQHPILKGRTQKRVRLFNKLLGCLIKGQYHPARTTRHAQRYWDQLQNSQTDRTIHLLDQEPVPYEVLWELILGHLSVRQESKVGRK